jgi:hypothetical protein
MLREDHARHFTAREPAPGEFRIGLMPEQLIVMRGADGAANGVVVEPNRRADFSHDVQKIENRWKICPECGRRRPVHLHPPPNYKGC